MIVNAGVLGGLGLGLISLPAIVSVGFYFESRRALATGISGTIHHLVNVTSYKENSDQTKKQVLDRTGVAQHF